MELINDDIDFDEFQREILRAGKLVTSLNIKTNIYLN